MTVVIKSPAFEGLYPDAMRQRSLVILALNGGSIQPFCLLYLVLQLTGPLVEGDSQKFMIRLTWIPLIVILLLLPWISHRIKPLLFAPIARHVAGVFSGHPREFSREAVASAWRDKVAEYAAGDSQLEYDTRHDWLWERYQRVCRERSVNICPAGCSRARTVLIFLAVATALVGIACFVRDGLLWSGGSELQAQYSFRNIIAFGISALCLWVMAADSQRICRDTCQAAVLQCFASVFSGDQPPGEPAVVVAGKAEVE